MTDSILIVGGGVAGLHAALECASAGAHAIVVEQRPVVGGKLAAAMTEATAIGDRGDGAPIPLFDALAENENIEIITLAELESIAGRPGSFSVSIREHARFVTDTCTRCNLCRAACPVVLPNEYDAGLTYRKAIFTPMAQTLPTEYVIDIDNCLNVPPNYLPCNRCAEVCADDSIHFDLALDKTHERLVAAVIVATGFEVEDGTVFAELGYGAHPDVVTSAELQRLLEAPGPTGGYATKPSAEEYPESVLLVLEELSSFGLYVVASQVHQLMSQDVDRVAVLVLVQPNSAAAEKGLSLSEQTGVSVRWGTGFLVEPGPDNSLDVSFEDFAERHLVRDRFDLVVLCSDVQPAGELAGLAATLGIDLAENGYVATGDGAAATSRDGIYVAGCASGPKNIKASVADAQAAATAALADLNQRLLRPDYAPAAQDIVAEPARDNAEPDMRRRIEQMLYSLLEKS